MYQKYVALGRTTKDVRLWYSPDGQSVANFTLAVNRKNKADFIPCVAWGNMAKTYADNVGKGSLILVEGEFRSYTRDKQDGVEYELKLEVHEVKFIDLKPVNNGNEMEQNTDS